MPDWQRIVDEHLPGLALDAEESREVIEELAAHLQESYERFRKQGLPEREATQRALEEVTDWKDLGRTIALAKKGEFLMEKRVQQLWIPGFVTLILSMVFLTALQKLGFQPRIIWSGPTALLLYGPWLLSLPFFGALGAYVSSRAGGARGTMLLASVFPVLALGTAFLLMFPIGMVVERITGNHVEFGTVATSLLRNGIGWLLFPGVALLAGGLLALFLFSPRSSSRGAAVG